MRVLGLVSCLALATGCPALDSYRCERDEDCNRGGVQGRCLPDTACAYPESNGRCPSGWARSPNAADSPGACTEEPTTGDTSTTGGPSTPGSSGAVASTARSSSDSSGENPCATAEVTLDTAVFSAGAGLSSFVLWLPLTQWPKGAARIEDGEGLVISDVEGVRRPFELSPLLEGTPALWIQLPAFAANDPVTLQFTFGVDIDGSDPEAVWQDDYIGVWHLDDAPMGLDGDVVRNALVAEDPGMMYGSMQADQQIDGQLGAALRFDGDDDRVEIDAGFVGMLDSYTISMWIRPDDPDVANRGSFFGRLNGDNLYPRCWHGSATSGILLCQHRIDEETHSASSDDDLPIGEFVHVAFSRDADAQRTTLFLQGEAIDAIEDPLGTLAGGDLPLEVGHGEWGTLLGAIDEVRVSDRPVTPEQVRADVRSQLRGIELATFGPLQGTSCPL